MKSRSKRFNEFGEDLSQKRRELLERCAVACITIFAIVVVGYAAIRNEQTRKVKRSVASPVLSKPIVQVAEVLKGMEFLKDNDNGAAAASFSRAVELDRKNVEALVGRGVSLARSGDLASAESDFLASLHLNANSSAIYNNIAYIRSKKKDYRTAIESYSKAIELDCNLVAAYGGRAFCYFQKDDYSSALDDLSHIIRLDKRNAPAWFNRAIVLGKMNRFETAIVNLTNPIVQSLGLIENRKLASFFQTQSGVPTDGLTNSKIGLEQNPNDPDFAFLSLLALKSIAESESDPESTKAWQDAKDQTALEVVAKGQANLEKLCSSFLLEGSCSPQLILFTNLSTVTAPLSENVATQQLQEAREYLKVGDLETAVACFRESLRNSPNSKATAVELALTMLNQNRNALAAEELSKLAKRFPEDTKILDVLSMVYSRIEKYSDAIGALDRAISIDQNDPALYLHRANVRFLSSQDYDLVVEDCKRTERLGTINSDLLDIKGRALAKLDQFAASIDSHTAAIEKSPESDSLLLHRAETYRLFNKVDLAIADANQALALKPSSSTYLEVASCYSDKGDYANALDAIEKSLALTPKDLSATLLKGQLLTKLKRYRDAVNVLKPLEAKSKSNDVLKCLAICFFQLKEPDVAWNYISKYLEKGETNVETWEIAAKIAHAIGDYAKAKVFIERYIKDGGDSAEIDYLLGKYASDRLDWSGAVDHFKKCLKKRASSPEAWLAAGEAMEHLKQPEKALQCYANAIKLQQDDPKPRIARAKLHVTIANYQGAMADLEWLNENNILDGETAKMLDVCKSKLVKTRAKRSSPLRSR